MLSWRIDRAVSFFELKYVTTTNVHLAFCPEKTPNPSRLFAVLPLLPYHFQPSHTWS